jgi:hypothetical protein
MNNIQEILARLEAEVGELTYIKSSGSYDSPCPICGGDDRFGYTPDPRNHPGAAAKGGLFNCRQCHFRGTGAMLLDHLKNGRTFLPKITTTQNQPKPCTPHQFKAPEVPWQRSFSSFLSTFSLSLTENSAQPLIERGISLATAQRYCIIPITQSFRHPAGLVAQGTHAADTGQATFAETYGPGIIIPARRNNTLFKVEVRNFDPHGAKGKYANISGSSSHPMIFPDQTTNSGTFIIVESLLDGYMLNSQVPDLVTPIALSSTNTSLDQEVVTTLEQAKNILICLDNDKAGLDKSRQINEQFPKSTIIIPPYGKDPGEFFQRGGDLREWLEQELNGTGQSDQSVKPKTQVKVCSNKEKLDEYLQIILNCNGPVSMAMKTGSITYTSESESFQNTQIEFLAFFVPDNQVIVFDLLNIGIDQIKPVFEKKLIVCNGVNALCHLNKSSETIKNVDCVLLMDNAIRNKPIKSHTDLDSLAYLVGEPPSLNMAITRNEIIRNIARESKLIHKLHTYLSSQLEECKKFQLYNLMKSAQPAIAQIRLNGFFYKKGRTEDNYRKFLNSLTGRIVNNTQISGTITGRFTSSSPSLHNVPKDEKTRSRFLAPEGSSLIRGDFNQIQLRIIAELSNDQALRDVFAQGRDLHLATAAAISNLLENQAHSYRSIAKTVNFGIVFGQSARGLQESLHKQGIEVTLEEAQAYQDKFFELFPRVKAWIDNSVDSQTRDSRWKAVSPMGRERDLGWYGYNKRRELINTPVQAAEAEILLATLALLPDLLEPFQAKLIHTVHDEIILECLDASLGPAKEALATAMTQGFLTIFPGATTNNLVDIVVSKTWTK